MAISTQASPDIVSINVVECWNHLRRERLGRVAIVARGRPHIFPVNYVASERVIVFRTGGGLKLAHGPGSSSCFEVDGFDKESKVGWSVMAFGRLVDITTATDALTSAFRRLPVEPQAPGTRTHWLAMHIDELTGMRFIGGWAVPGNFLG